MNPCLSRSAICSSSSFCSAGDNLYGGRDGGALPSCSRMSKTTSRFGGAPIGSSSGNTSLKSSIIHLSCSLCSWSTRCKISSRRCSALMKSFLGPTSVFLPILTAFTFPPTLFFLSFFSFLSFSFSHTPSPILRTTAKKICSPRLTTLLMFLAVNMDLCLEALLTVFT